MATILSLKELRSSSTLKSEIGQLEADKVELLEQIEREIQVQKDLRLELLEHKKDFEHLEKQFEHFADIESEFEDLQHEVQMERLEQMISGDKKEGQHKSLIKKSKQETGLLQRELKELKVLDPQRLKRQVGDLKKKAITQASENKTVNKALITSRKEFKEVSAEKDKLEGEIKASLKQTDFFWQSTQSEWLLFETELVLKDEKVEKDSNPKRIRCLNTLTGVSVVSKELGTEGDDKDLAIWLGDIDIPKDISEEAGKRLKNIAAEAEDDD